MPRMYVYLSNEMAERISELAEKNHRHPKDQVVYLLDIILGLAPTPGPGEVHEGASGPGEEPHHGSH